MEFVKRAWTQIKTQADGMPRSTRMLIASMVVIMVLVGSLLTLYAGRSADFAISDFTQSSPVEVAQVLSARGINVIDKNGQIYVAQSDKNRALAALMENNLFSSDTSAAFEEMMSQQTWWWGREQSEAASRIATQKGLAGMLRGMNGIASAEVIISETGRVGFGGGHERPSATVKLELRGAEQLASTQVRAIANAVSSAVAEMQPSDVAIFDQNRDYTMGDEGAFAMTERIESLQAHSAYYQRTIAQTLQYIPGVVVSVNVITDDVAQQVDHTTQYEADPRPSSRSSSEMTTEQLQQSNEPGVRPNTRVSVASAQGGGSGTSQRTETTDDEFFSPLATNESTIERVGHQIKQVNVSISVPRAYFLKIWEAENPEAEEAPTNAELLALATPELEEIESLAKPLALAMDEPQVIARMVSDETILGPRPQTASQGGVMAWLDSGSATGVTVIALAGFALAMTLFMVRKATAPQPLPSVEELAGVPPTLPTEEELVGEVEESESSMVGIELDDEELEARRIAEQISDMVKANPDEASQLLKRWVNEEDA